MIVTCQIQSPYVAGPSRLCCEFCGSTALTAMGKMLLGIFPLRSYFRCRQCGKESPRAAYTKPEKETKK